MRTPNVFLALLFVSTTMLAQLPTRLEFIDQTAGVTLTRPEPIWMLAGHIITIRLYGNPGEQTMLAYSILPPQTTTTFQGVPIGLDVTTMTVVWDGTTNPSAPVIGPAGFLDVGIVAPVVLDIFTYHVQAATFGPTGARLANALQIVPSNEVLFHLERGADTLHPQGATGGLVSITSATAWQTFWSLHAPATSPRPLVDFNTSFLLVRFGGEGLCFSAGINSVDIDLNGVLQVDTTLFFGCGAPRPFPIPTNRPYDIVAVPAVLATAPINETVNTFIAP